MGKRKASHNLSGLRDRNGENLSEESSQELTVEPIWEPYEELREEESVPWLSSDNYSNDSECCSESDQGSLTKLKNSVDRRGAAQTVQSGNKYVKVLSLEIELGTKSPITAIQEKSSIIMSLVKNGNDSEEQQKSGSGKQSCSWWDAQPEGARDFEGDLTSKRRRTRWATEESQTKMLGPIQLPDFVKSLVSGADEDPEIRELNSQLLQINRNLQGPGLLDHRLENERSPSPPLLYNNLGTRTNMREVRFREKLIMKRQEILSRLTQENPTFKRPSEFAPAKLYRKLYIPLKEYPGYNFIGLIIGPRGNTLKRMEKKVGAKIVIRGKGSVKGKSLQKRNTKNDQTIDDDLHVLVEAPDEKSLDATVRLVEKLLVPVEEKKNEHKRAQLKELAKLNGISRGENLWTACGEQQNRQNVCFRRDTALKMDITCQVCGELNHPTFFCPLAASGPGNKTDSQYYHIFTDLGGWKPHFAPHVLNRRSFRENVALHSLPSYAFDSHSGLGSLPQTDSKLKKDNDDTSVYVGYLPQNVDDNWLVGMFSRFGRLSNAKVIRDRTTGICKDYGFVEYTDSVSAATAVKHMNRHKVDGKLLAVRTVGSQQALPDLEPVGFKAGCLLPKNQGPEPAPYENPSAWPGLPGSQLPKDCASFLESEAFSLPPSGYLGRSDSFRRGLTSSNGSPYLLPLFPGNLTSFSY